MLIELSVIPVGAGPQLKMPVAQVVDMIDKSGLPYQVTAISTIIEGTWERVMPLVEQCLDDVPRSAPRLVAMIEVDGEGGATGPLEENMADVEERLGRRPPSPEAVQTKARSRQQETTMPRKKHLSGVSAKEQRQYEHIKDSAEKSGRYGKRAKEVAARTVMKHHKGEGHKKGR